VVAALAVLAVLVFYLANATKVDRHSAGGIARGESWVSRQWHDFMQPSIFSQAGSARLTSARGTRSELYRVALRGFEAHPLRGDGAGAYEFRYAHDRRIAEDVRNAHSLYLETIDELGVVGIALLLAFVASVAAAAIRSRLRTGALGRSQTAAVAGAVAVWVAHAGVDWDWQMPALTGAALMLAACLFPYGRGVRRRRFGYGEAAFSAADECYGAPDSQRQAQAGRALSEDRSRAG
jgi:hypothetical protein